MTTAVANATGPLAGVKVIDLTVNVLGPLCTMLLGDLGADVIKVEPPGGEPNRRTGPSRNPNMSAMHMNINRSKRSITLNLKRPEALAALMRLVKDADVLVHSMRPSAAKRLGIDYASLAKINPRLVYAFAPGYLQQGPRANDPAFDDVLQGETGLADLMLRSVGQARYLPTVMIDKFCGYALSSAIGMALYARERTGLGQEVVQPMFETIVSFNLHEHLWGAAFEPPLGSGIGYVRLLSKHRRPYETQDGYICALAVHDDQWRRLLPAIGRPELVEDPRFASVDTRLQYIDDVYGVVAEQLKLKTTAEWHEILDAIEIPNGVMAKFEDLLNDAYLKETGFLRRYEHPTEGTMVATGVPTQFSATPAGTPRPPATLGQDNLDVFRAAGYTDAEIEDLIR